MKKLLYFSIVLLLSSSYAFGSQASASASAQPQAQSAASMTAGSGLTFGADLSTLLPVSPVELPASTAAADVKIGAETQAKQLTIEDLYGESFEENVDVTLKFLFKNRTQHVDDATLLNARITATQLVLLNKQSLTLTSGFKSLGSKIDSLQSEHRLIRLAIEDMQRTLRTSSRK